MEGSVNNNDEKNKDVVGESETPDKNSMAEEEYYQLGRIESILKNQIEIKDGLIDKLHSELEYYKEDVASRYIEQVMKGIIKVRKDMINRMKSDSWGEISLDRLKDEYLYVLEDLSDLLEQQNIDIYKSEAGTVFDASIHQAKVETTKDNNLDKQIKESISDGYRKGNRVIIPERVIVYQYKESEEK